MYAIISRSINLICNIICLACAVMYIINIYVYHSVVSKCRSRDIFNRKKIVSQFIRYEHMRYPNRNGQTKKNNNMFAMAILYMWKIFDILKSFLISIRIAAATTKTTITPRK